VKYFNESKNDSINSLFTLWHKQFGLCEPLQRAIIIYHLKANTFNDSILGDSISCNIMKYLDRRNNDYFNNERYFSFVPIGKEFDKFTDSVSKIVIHNYKRKSIEHLLCELYSNTSDSILIKVKSPIYKKSKIHNIPCDQHIKRRFKSGFINKEGWGIALMSGIWIPTGEQKILGIHPELGFQSGIKKAGYSAQFTLIIKFLNTPNQYLAKRVHSNDSIVPTNQFVGPYIGMDFGKSIIEFNKSELQFLIGIGFDAFTALDPLSDAYSRYEDVRSYNINFGLRYNYFFKSQHSYIGIEPKFNFVDYSLTGVTALKGNFISVRFIYAYKDKGFDKK
jgi:hypothetical protein